MTSEDTSPTAQVRLTRGPIETPHPFPPSNLPQAGAVLMFRGVVRPHEVNQSGDINPDTSSANASPIDGLEYQVYEPMTTRELRRLAEAQVVKHGVIAADVEHSFGLIASGECSFILQVAGKHRGEAIRFMDEFIIEMKRHVPIWKVPHWQTR